MEIGRKGRSKGDVEVGKGTTKGDMVVGREGSPHFPHHYITTQVSPTGFSFSSKTPRHSGRTVESHCHISGT